MLDNARLQELKRNVFYKYFACNGEDQERVFADRNDLISLIDSAMNKPDCSTAEWCGGKCCGYGKAENDDEPIDACKACPKQAGYGVE